jgi:hypothetical protein
MGTSHYILWNETLDGRGSNETSSCFVKWALDHVNPGTKELTVWSDSCPGQNHNTLIVLAYMWHLRKIKSLEIINHKYLRNGHTHLDANHVHGVIERRKSSLKPFEIAVPRDWPQFI